MLDIPHQRVPEKGRGHPNHGSRQPGAPGTQVERLARGPRSRACRGVLEIAGLVHELRDLLDPVLRKARKRRDRADTLSLEGAFVALADLGAEADQVESGLVQLDVLWSHGEPGGRS